jgi:hypothetical protein
MRQWNIFSGKGAGERGIGNKRIRSRVMAVVVKLTLPYSYSGIYN